MGKGNLGRHRRPGKVRERHEAPDALDEDFKRRQRDDEYVAPPRAKEPFTSASTKHNHGFNPHETERKALQLLFERTLIVKQRARRFGRFERWYMVRYSPARHCSYAKLCNRNYVVMDDDGMGVFFLAVHPEKLLRDFEDCYVPPPPNAAHWTQREREEYTIQVRDKIVARQGRGKVTIIGDAVNARAIAQEDRAKQRRVAKILAAEKVSDTKPPPAAPATAGSPQNAKSSSSATRARRNRRKRQEAREFAQGIVWPDEIEEDACTNSVDQINGHQGTSQGTCYVDGVVVTPVHEERSFSPFIGGSHGEETLEDDLAARIGGGIDDALAQLKNVSAHIDHLDRKRQFKEAKNRKIHARARNEKSDKVAVPAAKVALPKAPAPPATKAQTPPATPKTAPTPVIVPAPPLEVAKPTGFRGHSLFQGMQPPCAPLGVPGLTTVEYDPAAEVKAYGWSLLLPFKAPKTFRVTPDELTIPLRKRSVPTAWFNFCFAGFSPHAVHSSHSPLIVFLRHLYFLDEALVRRAAWIATRAVRQYLVRKDRRKRVEWNYRGGEADLRARCVNWYPKFAESVRYIRQFGFKETYLQSTLPNSRVCSLINGRTLFTIYGSYKLKDKPLTLSKRRTLVLPEMRRSELFLACAQRIAVEEFREWRAMKVIRHFLRRKVCPLFRVPRYGVSPWQALSEDRHWRVNPGKVPTRQRVELPIHGEYEHTSPCYDAFKVLCSDLHEWWYNTTTAYERNRVDGIEANDMAVIHRLKPNVNQVTRKLGYGYVSDVVVYREVVDRMVATYSSTLKWSDFAVARATSETRSWFEREFPDTRVDNRVLVDSFSLGIVQLRVLTANLVSRTPADGSVAKIPWK